MEEKDLIWVVTKEEVSRRGRGLKQLKAEELSRRNKSTHATSIPYPWYYKLSACYTQREVKRFLWWTLQPAAAKSTIKMM